MIGCRHISCFSRVALLSHAVLAVLLLAALPGCSWWKPAFQDPDIQVISFTALPSDNLLEQRFALKLRLTNPNDLRLQVKGLAFEFSVEGVDLMRGQSRDIPVIEPYADAEFSVEGSANVLDAAQLLFHELQSDPDARFDYVLKTRVDLANHWPSTFNIQRDGQIDLLKSSRNRRGQ